MASDLRIGVSVSESADLARLGLVEKHLRLALGEIARVIIRNGSQIVYGGHLRDDGYTAFLEREVERYGGDRSVLRLVVPWSEHRPMFLSTLRKHRDRLSMNSSIYYLDADGGVLPSDDFRGEDGEAVDDVAGSLTSLRRRLAQETNARVLLGGKEQGFAGAMPGVVEEALLAAAANQPIYLAGGFGGAAATLAAAAIGFHERFPPSQVDLQGLRNKLCETGWRLSSNGLDDEENRRLAITHRPSEIATLIAVGMRRIGQ